ncbi:MAG: hypothetical protein B1H03_06500 [Planctomycetales bacterium 4484_113]|nr:MAG: hypothetical protein B1H03_06500 [Planctomycetales bacterium 4484_113]
MALTVMLAAVALAFAAGCRQKTESASPLVSSTASSASIPAPAREKEARYWKPRGSGSVELAWKQQTKLHQMFIKKYDAADDAGKEKLKSELEMVYFRTNGVLVQLFEDAISENPDEPANYISYGFYLLPRKGQFENAIALIEKGMDMERDNAGFHFLLAHAYVAPFRSGEFSTSDKTRNIRYKRYRGKFEVELQRARKLMPDNAFFDYYEAVTTYHFNGNLDVAWELVQQGNEKPESYFILPPPLAMLSDTWVSQYTYPDNFHLYWNFGYYPADDFIKLAVDLLTSGKVKDSPSKIFEVARFVFHASQTRPYDRLYHFVLGLVIEQALTYYGDLGSDKKVEELKQVRKFYDEITTTMDELLRQEVIGSEPGVKPPKDPLDLEVQLRRQYKALGPVFPLELRLMKKLRDALNLDAEQHPLFNDLWQAE